MKHFFSLLVLMLLSSGSVFAQPLQKIMEFGSNPGNLQMNVFIPEGIERSDSTALVVVLHGCYQTAEEIAEQSGWNKLAETHRFIVLYPQQRKINNGVNCFNWFNEADRAAEGGEMESIIHMMDYLNLEYQINRSSTFIYGLSAGAAASMNLLARYPERFSAGALFAGGPFTTSVNAFSAFDFMHFPDDLSPEVRGEVVLSQHSDSTHYPRIIIGHGKHDPVVHFQNSLEILDQWTFVHGVNLAPTNTDSSFTNNQRIMRLTYGDSIAPEIIFYQFIEGKHELPIDPGNLTNQGGKVGAFVKDYDFFSTYYVAKDFGLMKGE